MAKEELLKALDNALEIIKTYGPLRIERSENITIGKYTLPKSYAGNQLISSDFKIVREIEEELGYLSTFSIAIPEGLVRISTSLKDQAGNYVIGTIMDNTNTICISIKNGSRVHGREWILNDFFETVDIPLYDEGGNLIMSFGLGFRENMGEREIVIFSLGGQIYAMNIMFISEVVRLPENIITTTSNNEYILGLHTLGEEVIPVLDSLKIFGCDSMEYSMLKSNDRKMLIIQIEDRKHGMIVDKVFGLGKYDLKDMERIRLSDIDLAHSNITDGVIPIVRSFSDVPVILGDKVVKIANGKIKK
jgi:chemotaxis signal transduction protein